MVNVTDSVAPPAHAVLVKFTGVVVEVRRTRFEQDAAAPEIDGVGQVPVSMAVLQLPLLSSWCIWNT
jgi:hypothetical protein